MLIGLLVVRIMISKVQKKPVKMQPGNAKRFHTWEKGNLPPLLLQLQKVLEAPWEVEWLGWSQSQGQVSFPLCGKVVFKGLEAHSPFVTAHRSIPGE